MTTRAERRRMTRLMAKSARSPVNWGLFVKEAKAQSNETRGLRYGAFDHVHVGCGGAVQLPNNYAAGPYCGECERTVPWDEVGELEGAPR